MRRILFAFFFILISALAVFASLPNFPGAEFIFASSSSDLPLIITVKITVNGHSYLDREYDYKMTKSEEKIRISIPPRDYKSKLQVYRQEKKSKSLILEIESDKLWRQSGPNYISLKKQDNLGKIVCYKKIFDRYELCMYDLDENQKSILAYTKSIGKMYCEDGNLYFFDGSNAVLMNTNLSNYKKINYPTIDIFPIIWPVSLLQNVLIHVSTNCQYYSYKEINPRYLQEQIEKKNSNIHISPNKNIKVYWEKEYWENKYVFFFWILDKYGKKTKIFEKKGFISVPRFLGWTNKGDLIFLIGKMGKTVNKYKIVKFDIDLLECQDLIELGNIIELDSMDPENHYTIKI